MLYGKYGLKKVVNAWGTATRYGVSRSSKAVVEAVGEALANYFDMNELERVAGEGIARFSGAEWGCVTHCTASAITLSVAATMTGSDTDLINKLPDVRGLKSNVLIPAGHRVNYGGQITQAISLSGARVLPVGSDEGTTAAQLETALGDGQVTALVYVVSHLTKGQVVSLEEAVALAHAHGVPVLLDAAAQDLRLEQLLAAGPDLLFLSGQKYLNAPTGGIVLGRRDLVNAVALQHVGIGRCMKPSKESIFGVLAALEQRAEQGLASWAEQSAGKVSYLADRLAKHPGLKVTVVPDPTECPFSRVRIHPVKGISPFTAPELVTQLAAGDPVVAVGGHYAHLGYLNLEVGALTHIELEMLADRIEFLATP